MPCTHKPSGASICLRSGFHTISSIFLACNVLCIRRFPQLSRHLHVICWLPSPHARHHQGRGGLATHGPEEQMKRTTKSPRH